VHNLADPNYCLDNRGSTTAGAQLGTWFCADGTGASRDNLRFNQAADGKLTSRVSGLAVTAPTGGTGLLSQQSVNSSAAQKWNAGAAGKLSNGPIPYDAY
jgi:hypothetical protein